MNTYFSLTCIINTSKEARKQGKKIGLITGSFDIIHPGHTHFLREARSQCDLLIIGLENDFNIKRVKGHARPIHSFNDRADVLSELKSVDYIFKVEPEFAEFNAEAEQFYSDLLINIKPHYLFTTTTKDEYFEQKKTKALQAGAVLIGIEMKHNTSTTELSQKLLKDF